MQSVAKHLCYDHFFLTSNYHFEMIRKIIFTNYSSKFIHHVAIKMQVPKGLAEEVFSIRHYIKTLSQNAADKILKRLTNFMISISLFERFCCQHFVTILKSST